MHATRTDGGGVENRSAWARAALATVASFLGATAGCADEPGPGEAPPTAITVEGCAYGETRHPDGGCRPPGLPADMPCRPGQVQMANGGCQPAGIPPASCGAGFVTTGDGGCVPILPARDCNGGTLALPGKSTCEYITLCKPGLYGGELLDPSMAQFVDASYQGDVHDGTPQRPWNTVQEAVDAAAPGAVVAIAEGRYEEQVLIQGKPVRLWGLCPRLVALAGAGGQAAVTIRGEAASRSEVRTAFIRGVQVQGATQIVLDRLWVYNAPGAGLRVEAAGGPASAVLRGSLIDNARGFGIAVIGSQVEVEASSVRDTVPIPGVEASGIGIYLQEDERLHLRSQGTIRSSVFERNSTEGVAVRASDVTLEGTVVRQTLTHQGKFGLGIHISRNALTDERASARILGSYIDQNRTHGIYVDGSDARIEATVVRSTRADDFGQNGQGLFVEDRGEPERGSGVQVVASLVERNQRSGVVALGARVSIEATIVRETEPNVNAFGGMGIAVYDHPETLARAEVNVLGSLVEWNQHAGVLVAGADVTLDATVVRYTLPNFGQLGGQGIFAARSPSTKAAAHATVLRSLIERNRTAGVHVVGSGLLMENCLVQRTRAPDADVFGDGVTIVSDEEGLAQATITGSHVDLNARAGVANFGAAIDMSSNAMTCNAFDIEGEHLADTRFSFGGNADNLCGCPMGQRACKAVSASLSPPPSDRVDPGGP